MSGLQLVLEIFSLVLQLIEFSVKLLHLSIISSFLDESISVIKLLKLGCLESYLFFLTNDLLLQFFGLNINLVGSFTLISDLLVQSGGHVLQLLLEHTNSFFSKLSLLLKVVLSVGKLIINALLLKVLF